MTADEVISRSKLLKKALILGVIYKAKYGYTVECLELGLTYGTGKTWCYKKDNWVAITSVEQVEAVFKRTVRDG